MKTLYFYGAYLKNNVFWKKYFHFCNLYFLQDRLYICWLLIQKFWNWSKILQIEHFFGLTFWSERCQNIESIFPILWERLIKYYAPTDLTVVRSFFIFLFWNKSRFPLGLLFEFQLLNLWEYIFKKERLNNLGNLFSISWNVLNEVLTFCR
jgi:hypothetical protein